MDWGEAEREEKQIKSVINVEQWWISVQSVARQPSLLIVKVKFSLCLLTQHAINTRTNRGVPEDTTQHARRK